MIRRKAHLLSLIALVTLSLPLTLTSAQDCSQVPLITLRTLNGTANSPSSVGVNVTGVLNSALTNQTFISTYLSSGTSAAFNALSFSLSTFIGTGLNCTGFGANDTFLQANGTSLEQTLRLNSTQFAFFINQTLQAAASVNFTQQFINATLLPYLNSFIVGSAFPICNTSDCPSVPTTPTPTTPAPTSPPTTANSTLTGPVFHVASNSGINSWNFLSNGTLYANPTLLLSPNTSYSIEIDFASNSHPFGFSTFGPGSTNIGQLASLIVGPGCTQSVNFSNAYITTNASTPCTLNFTIPHPITFYYRCATHVRMVGTIIVQSGNVTTGDSSDVFVTPTATPTPTPTATSPPTTATTNTTASPTNATTTTAPPTTTPTPTTLPPTTPTPTTPAPTLLPTLSPPQNCSNVTVLVDNVFWKMVPVIGYLNTSSTILQPLIVNGTQQYYYVNTTSNVTVIGPAYSSQNVSLLGYLNQTNYVSAVVNTTLTNQSTTINGTTTYQLVNVTLYQVMQNVTVTSSVLTTLGYTNQSFVFGQVPTVVTVCYNQTCSLVTYLANYTTYNIASQNITATALANVTTLSPINASVITYQPVNVTVYQIQYVNQSFLTFQSTLVNDYGWVNTTNTTLVPANNYTALQPVGNYTVATNVSNPYTVLHPTGNTTTSIITVQVPIYTYSLQNVTSLQTRLVPKNVTVTQFNNTVQNMSTTNTTFVLVPVTTLTNVTYMDNVTSPQPYNYTVTNYTMGNTSVLIGYNVTFFNITYNTTLVNGTNVTTVASNTTYVQTYDIPTYNASNITNGTAIYNVTLTNTTHVYNLTGTQNVQSQQLVNKILNITTFQTQNVTVPSWSLVNVSVPYNVTVQQLVTDYYYTTSLQNKSVPIGYITENQLLTQQIYQNVTYPNDTIVYETKYNSTLVNVTLTNYTSVTTNFSNYTIIGSHYASAPVIVNQTVAVLTAYNYTIYQPVLTSFVVNYTSTSSFQSVPAIVQNFTAVPVTAYVNASRLNCTVPTPPPPPPNVTITTCQWYLKGVYGPVTINITTPTPVNRTIPYNVTTTTYIVNNVTTSNTTYKTANISFTIPVINSTLQYNLVNVTNYTLTTVQIPIIQLANVSVPSYTTVASANVTIPVNQSTTTNVPTFAVVPVYAIQNITVQVNRTFQVPVFTNASSTVFIYGTMNLTSNVTLQNVSTTSNQSSLQTMYVNQTIPVYQYVNVTQNITTLAGYNYTLKNVSTPVYQNVTQNITVPDTTVTVVVVVPPTVNTYNVSFPNGTWELVNVTSNSTAYNVTYLVPSFNTTQNVSVLVSNQSTLQNVSVPFYTWSSQNVTILQPNGTITNQVAQNITVNTTTWSFQNVTTYYFPNGTISPTPTIQVVIDNTTQYNLVETFRTDVQTTNVTTQALVQVGTIEYPTTQNITTVALVNQTVTLPNVTIVTYNIQLQNVTIGYNTSTLNNTYVYVQNQSSIVNITTNFTSWKLENQSTTTYGWYIQNITNTTIQTLYNITTVVINITTPTTVQKIVSYANDTKCSNWTGPLGTYPYPTYPQASTFCYKATGTYSGAAQRDSLNNLLRWAWQGINITAFPNINFPGWLNQPQIAPYFEGQYIYDPPYQSPFAAGLANNIDFTSPLYTDKLALLMDHFIQYFGQLWGCQGQKGDRFPDYQGNPNMPSIHAGMNINYTLYQTFYNQVALALTYQGMNPVDIANMTSTFFQTGPFLRGGQYQICSQPDCPCAPGTFLCSGKCQALCPVLPSDPICIKLVKTVTAQQGFTVTNTNASYAALQMALKTAFLGSAGQYQNGVSVMGLLNSSSPTSAIYMTNAALASTNTNTSTTELNNVIAQYAAFLGRDLGCGLNPLDGTFPNYTGPALSTVHANLGINFTTFTTWFNIVESALIYYGVPKADIDAILPAYEQTFYRGSPNAVCTTPDCPCAPGLLTVNSTCVTPAPATTAPTKGPPTGIPTLPPATSAPNGTLAPTPGPTTNLNTTIPPTTTPTTGAPTTTSAPSTTAPPSTLPSSAATLQVGPVIIACVTMLLSWLL